MSTLYVMTGLPGSGKSFFASKIQKMTGGSIVSSDAMREQLFGDASIQKNPQLVFEKVDEEVERLCYLDIDAIYDATNIKAKTRRQILEKHPNFHRFVCVYVGASIEDCLERNSKRERNVPAEVIERMNRNFQPPTNSEGFDEIVKICN